MPSTPWKSAGRGNLPLVSLAGLGLAAVVCSCGSSAELLGVTPGGSQDISLAREIIEAGGVPTQIQFTAEGLYSEHDLSLAEPPDCGDHIVCLGAAVGLEPALDHDGQDLLVQLGLSSSIAEGSFERDPLNLGIVVDTSGSMTGNLEGVKEALHALLDQLDGEDRVALVVFEAISYTVQPSTPATDLEALHAAVDRLEVGGSTNMEAGMRLGYAEMAPFVDKEHLSRLVVFTDAMTNTGLTDAGSFQALTEAAAAIDMGFTFFGFGGSFDAEFVDQIAHLRGGNYRFVRAEDVTPIFEEELDYLVTPVAYDLRVTLEAEVGTSLVEVLGIPQAEEHQSGSLFDVSTLFLSKRKGAIVLRLDGTEAERLYGGGVLRVGEAAVSFTEVGGEEVSETLSLETSLTALPEPGAPFYPDPEMQRTMAVTAQFLAMREVCGDYHQGGFDTLEAAALLDAAIEKLEAAYALIEDENLTREIALLEQLKINVGAGL